MDARTKEAATVMKSIAATIGNTLGSKGFTRSAAFVQAWGMTKARHITRVVGVTVGNRQEALRLLALYGRAKCGIVHILQAGRGGVVVAAAWIRAGPFQNLPRPIMIRLSKCERGFYCG